MTLTHPRQALMYKLDPEAAASVLGTRRAEGEQSLSTEEQAAVQIQVGFPTPHTRALDPGWISHTTHTFPASASPL